MLNYKILIKSRNIRELILRLLQFVPSKMMIKMQYRLHSGIKLSLKNPKRYTEKLQWYKLYYHDTLMHQCVDKYTVREYVKKKGLEEILIPSYGCFDSVEDITWDKLPDSFVLKLSNGGGGLNCIFCHNKADFDINKACYTLSYWLKKARKTKLSPGREWAYDDLKPRIVCEMLLNPDNQNGEGLDDYKFFCFNGKTALKWVDYDRYKKHKRVLFSTEGIYLKVKCTYENPESFQYPAEAFSAMQPIVDRLSEDFPHVRVDLYYSNHKVYFGELTFYSGGGYELFDPDEFDFMLGEKWELPPKKEGASGKKVGR